MNWFKRFYHENKAISWAAGISLIIVVIVLIMVRDEVTRFTLIMPVLAGFILFSILITSDEELEDEVAEKKETAPVKEKVETKKSKKKSRR